MALRVGARGAPARGAGRGGLNDVRWLLLVGLPDGTEAGVYRADDGLFVTRDARDLHRWTERLTEPLHVVSDDPLVVAGAFPPGVVDVRWSEEGRWRSIDAGDGFWMAVAEGAGGSLELVHADGRAERLPVGPADLPRPED